MAADRSSGPASDPAALRVDYGALARDGLGEGDLAPTPLEQWQRWWAEVARPGSPVAEPNAVVLATVDADGLPDARTVLLKGVDARGFVVYTNLGSAKARQLAAVPAAALVLPWHAAGRQVRVRGRVEQVPRAESAAYFASRPWGSKVGAWASAQSAPVAGRAPLQRAFDAAAARWPADGSAGDVPLPEDWGGYLVRPWEVEFWVGRSSRLHDRLVLRAARGGPSAPGAPGDPGGPPALDELGAWSLHRLQP